MSGIGARGRVMLALAAAVVVGGCADQGPETPMEELRANEDLWWSTRPEVYRYAVERLCFCLPLGPVRVTVSQASVVSRVFVDTGEVVGAESQGWYPSVEGLFDVVRHALETGADVVDVEYDPTTGVPVDVWIDYSTDTADEEMGYRVTEPVTEYD